MAKKILVLNGAARKNGSTAKLVRSFTEGAKNVGHSVEEFYLVGMDIYSCKGCLHAGRDAHSPCSQKNDMEQIYSAFADCDVVVFASPLYSREATSQVDVLARIFGLEKPWRGFRQRQNGSSQAVGCFPVNKVHK